MSTIDDNNDKHEPLEDESNKGDMMLRTNNIPRVIVVMRMTLNMNLLMMNM